MKSSFFFFFSSGTLQPVFRWKQGFVCAFGLEEGNGIKPHNFLGDEVEKYEAVPICKMIAATLWKTLGLFGREGCELHFHGSLPSAAVGWICTIPSSDFFFPSDLFFFFPTALLKDKANAFEALSGFLARKCPEFLSWELHQGRLWMSELQRWSGITAGILSLRQVEYCHQPLRAQSSHPSSQKELRKKHRGKNRSISHWELNKWKIPKPPHWNQQKCAKPWFKMIVAARATLGCELCPLWILWKKSWSTRKRGNGFKLPG